MSIEILKETGALLEGHFLLSSGRHSDRYAQNAKLLQYPDKAAEVLSVVAEKVKDLDIDVVCGPAMEMCIRDRILWSGSAGWIWIAPEKQAATAFTI